MWALALLAACAADKAVPVDSSANQDSADDSGVEAPWVPLDWGDCALLRDVGVLGEDDARLAFSPSVVGEDLFFSVAPEQGPQRVAHARLEGGAPVDDAVILVGPDLGASDLSSPALLEVDGERWMYLDAITAGELALWRCTSSARSGPGPWEGCERVLGPSRPEDEKGTQIPFAMEMEGGVRLWYTGVDEAGVRTILTAWSTDGLAFDAPEVAIPPGFEGQHDASAAYSPFVWHDGARYRLLYAGRSEEDGYLVKQLIEAWSEDGLSWQAPTLSLPRGCAGEGDAWRADAPWVVPEGEGHRLYYDGFDDPLTSEGQRRLFTAFSTN